jgi:signal transduction histidine kinase
MKVKLPEKIYILIVDDNPIDREVYRRILERKWEKRCEFDEADTGKKALEKVKHNTYQAILLDYGLPDMSGISFLESLPANVLSNTAILMITGHENLEMAISAFKTGVQDYLPKSNINADTLIYALRNALEKVLLQRLLQEQKAALEASYQTLERFAYVVAHDLQSPLRTVKGFVDLLAESTQNKLSKEEEEYLHFIIIGTERMSRLIKKLLELSKAKNSNLEVSKIDLNDLLKDVLHDLAVLIKETGAKIRLPKMPIIQADRELMYRLWLNVLHNAIKFVKDRKPVVKVDVQDNKESWLFSVTDNGIGIEKAKLEKIFQPFNRLNPMGKFEGTGLGLAICQKIVEHHHGKIWAESEVDKGTTISFRIPKTIPQAIQTDKERVKSA